MQPGETIRQLILTSSRNLFRRSASLDLPAWCNIRFVRCGVGMGELVGSEMAAMAAGCICLRLNLDAIIVYKLVAVGICGLYLSNSKPLPAHPVAFTTGF